MNSLQDNHNTKRDKVLQQLRIENADYRKHNSKLQNAIDDLKDSNDSLHQFFESSPCPHIILTSNGKIVDHNYEAERLLFEDSYPEGEVNFNQGLRAFDSKIFTRHLYQASKTGESVSTVFNWNLFQQDKVVKASTRFFPHQDVFLMAIWDITNEEKTKQSLKNAKRSAENASQLKSQFLANMSHEIRNPLSSILGYVQLLKEKFFSSFEDELACQYFRRVEVNANHLMSIINNILDLSEIEAGQLQIDLTNEDIRQRIEDIVYAFVQKAHEKGLNLELHFGDSVPKQVSIDIAKMRQVVINLIANAIKFTDDGEVTVLVDWSEPSHEDLAGELKIRVRDSGVGISQEARSKLFKNFSQIKSGQQKIKSGTGLGLVISKKIANLLNGDVVLESSEAGKGSCFSATFKVTPVTISPMKLTPTKNNNTSESYFEASKINPLQGVKILSCEDQPDMQLILKVILQNVGADVDFADDGLMAITKVLYGNYNIIFIDMEMPGCSGYKAVPLLRQHIGIKTPLIALTANALQEEKQKCLKLGCQGFVTKPFDPKVLLETVKTYASPQLEEFKYPDSLNLPSSYQKSLKKGYYEELPKYLNQLKNSKAKKQLHEFRSKSKTLTQMSHWIGDAELEGLFSRLSKCEDVYNLDMHSNVWYSIEKTIQEKLPKFNNIGTLH